MADDDGPKEKPKDRPPEKAIQDLIVWFVSLVGSSVPYPQGFLVTLKPLLETMMIAQEQINKVQDFHDSAYTASDEYMARILSTGKQDVNQLDEVCFSIV